MKMKKIIVVLALSVAFCLPQMAVADTVTTVGAPGGYGPYQTDRGGEFTLLPSGFAISGYSAKTSGFGGNAGTFQTFCVEENEYIYPNTTHTVVFNTAAVNGGLGWGNPDPLSEGSAYLYQKFATGTLAGYDYVTLSGRHTSARDLQNAFWMLEDETDYIAGNPYITQVIAEFGTLDGAKANYKGSSVKVLNLSINDGRAQDQLFYVPVPVPEPTTVLLLGLGMIGLAGIRRKMTR